VALRASVKAMKRQNNIPEEGAEAETGAEESAPDLHPSDQKEEASKVIYARVPVDAEIEVEPDAEISLKAERIKAVRLAEEKFRQQELHEETEEEEQGHMRARLIAEEQEATSASTVRQLKERFTTHSRPLRSNRGSHRPKLLLPSQRKLLQIWRER